MRKINEQNLTIAADRTDQMLLHLNGELRDAGLLGSQESVPILQAAVGVEIYYYGSIPG